MRVEESGVGDSESVLERSPFEAFAARPEIVAALGDPRLQKIISRIDGAEDREAELVNEMELNEDFRAFVEQMLEVTPPSIQA